MSTIAIIWGKLTDQQQQRAVELAKSGQSAPLTIMLRDAGALVQAGGCNCGHITPRSIMEQTLTAYKAGRLTKI